MRARHDGAYGRGMNATAPAQPEFGTGRLFLADSRMALAVLNHVRYQVLERSFGVSREQANVLTFVLVASAADAAYVATRKVVRVPLRLSATDSAIGAIALRDAALRVVGPEAREGPLVGTLLAFAIVGRFALPALREGTARLRAAERRVRERRIGRYRAVTRSAAG
jgi:hypothetical protein